MALVEVSFLALMASILLRAHFGINVWAKLLAWIKEQKVRTAELAKLRRMWGEA
jgi:hypothetical protein